MPPEAAFLAFILFVGLGASFRGWLRLDLAAVLIMLSLLVPWRRDETGELVGVLSVAEAFSGFGTPAVVMVAAIFVLSHAMERTGAAEMVGKRLLQASSKSEFAMQAAILLAATLFSALVSDTTTVLVWMPLILAVSRDKGLAPSRLLMPLAFAALLGGQWTLIGTRANVILSDYLRSQTGEGLGFFAFTPVAAVVWGVSCLFFLTIGRRLLPGSESQVSLADRYEVTEYLTEVMASASSAMVGQPLGALELDAQRVSILGIIRNEENLAPSPWVVIEPGDVLIIQGNISKISELMGKPGMQVREEMQVGDTTLRSVDLRMVEAVIGPASQFQNQRLADLDFHKDYNLSVLAIGRHGRPLSGRPMEQELQVGDSLLLVGHEEMIQRLRDDPNVFLAESRTLPVDGKAWTAIAWMIAMVLATAFRLVEPPVAVVVAAVGTILTRCVSLRGAYRAVDWHIVVLLGAMIPYGLALEHTGTAEYLATRVAEAMGALGPRGILAGLLLVAILLTQVLENSAAAVVLAPVAYRLALSVGAEPAPFLIGVAICCSAGFATPVAHECTLLVMGPGGYRLRHFLLVGAPLAVLTWIVTVLTVPIFFPL